MTKKNKKMLALLIVIVAVVLAGSIWLINNAEVPLLEGEYTIRLYDDNWEEIKSYSTIYVEYDGETKGINAIAYRDDEELYRLDWTDQEAYEKYIKFSVICNDGDPSTLPVYSSYMPYTVGIYDIVYKFDTTYWKQNPLYEDSGPKYVYSTECTMIIS